MEQREGRAIAEEDVAGNAAANAGEEAEAEDAGEVEARAAVAARGEATAERTEHDGRDLKKVEGGGGEPGCRGKRDGEGGECEMGEDVHTRSARVESCAFAIVAGFGKWRLVRGLPRLFELSHFGLRCAVMDEWLQV